MRSAEPPVTHLLSGRQHSHSKRGPIAREVAEKSVYKSSRGVTPMASEVSSGDETCKSQCDGGKDEILPRKERLDEGLALLALMLTGGHEPDCGGAHFGWNF